jgi:hypothetical protein
LPHFEVCNWRELAKSGELGLVEWYAHTQRLILLNFLVQLRPNLW